MQNVEATAPGPFQPVSATLKVNSLTNLLIRIQPAFLPDFAEPELKRFFYPPVSFFLT